MLKLPTTLIIPLMTFALLGCSAQNIVTPTTFKIDSETYQSVGKGERIKSIVLHYTVEDDVVSLDKLTSGNVSAHYLIPRQDNDVIYNLVPDTERAWHAGRGGFAGRQMLNDTSIGIEIVNDGIAKPYRTALQSGDYEYHPYNHYVDFTDLQIEKVAQLIQYLSKKYNIRPTHIIGHSDLAPSRKVDPGAKFPWRRLYKEYGIGAWYDEVDKQYFMQSNDFELASILEIKQALVDYGYMLSDDSLHTSAWDKESRNVIYAFQLHFRPRQPTGIMDIETYAILRALNKKYGRR